MLAGTTMAGQRQAEFVAVVFVVVIERLRRLAETVLVLDAVESSPGDFFGGLLPALVLLSREATNEGGPEATRAADGPTAASSVGLGDERCC